MAGSFRLSRVLRLQTQLRRLREHEVGAFEHERTRLGHEVDAVCEARAAVGAAEQRAAETDTLTLDQLRLGRDYGEALASKERGFRTAIAETECLLAAKREQLMTSHREESKIGRLQELYRERADEEEARVAAQALDELAIDRHERARRRG